MRKSIKLILEYILLFCTFGGIYFCLESIWKSHWTDWRMFLLSGFIGLCIGGINNLFTYETDFLLQCIVGMLIALLCECIFGYQWNVVEGLELWNYSNPPLSYLSAVAGQINLVFAVIWLGLSGVCIILDDWIWYYVLGHRDEKPYYQVFGKILFKRRES